MVDLGFWPPFQVGITFVLLGIGSGYVTPLYQKFDVAAYGCVGFWDFVLDFVETHIVVGYRCLFLWRVGAV
jgi:hypothetical protein